MTEGSDEEAPPGGFLSQPMNPFFLGAGTVALLAVVAWLLLIVQGAPVPGFLPATLWHGHELLFGFATAAMSGFLLTAAPNWSRRQVMRGAMLGGLFAIWLAGRGAIWVDIGFPRAAAVVAWLYVPALGAVAWPYLRAAGTRNMVFLLLLLALAIAQAMVLWGGLDGDLLLARRGLLLAADTFVLLVAVIGGRVVPAFTRNALMRDGLDAPVRVSGPRDRLALVSVIAVLVADQALPPAWSGWIAMIAGLAIAARMWGWLGSRTFHDPLLWVLHLGYGWLSVGLMWKGLCFAIGFGGMGAALHGVTVGAFGTMTLAVMSRAALGHSGRPLVAPRATSIAYVLVSVAAIARIAATAFGGGALSGLLMVSGAAWCAAFALFLYDFAPLLIGRDRG